MAKHIFKMVFFTIAFLLLSKQGFSQIDHTKLNNLRAKYPWGSIYITYISFINLNSILEDEVKLQYISTQYPVSALSTLQSFMRRNKSPNSSQAIAFIEIDLNRIEAGFKRANDVGGEITSIAWSKDDVVNIADLCDKQLNAITFVKNALTSIASDATPILTAFENVQNTKGNAFASSEAYFLLAKDFRLLLSKKDSSEIVKLPMNTQAMLSNFVKDFDAEYFKLQNIDFGSWISMNKAEAIEFKQNMTGLEQKLKENKY